MLPAETEAPVSSLGNATALATSSFSRSTARGRLVGEAWVPLAGLDAEEWALLGQHAGAPPPVLPGQPAARIVCGMRDKLRPHSRWSRAFGCCQECGTAERPHRSRGLCGTCYDRWNQARRQPRFRAERATDQLSREYLLQEYSSKGRSASEIAKEVGRSRQHVHSRLRALGIPTRSPSDARILALQKGKCAQVTEGRR